MLPPYLVIQLGPDSRDKALTQDPSAKRNALPAVYKFNNKEPGFFRFDKFFPVHSLSFGIKDLCISNFPRNPDIGVFAFFPVMLRKPPSQIICETYIIPV